MKNGYAKTGWLCLDYDEDNKPDDGTISEVRTSASDTAKWFYFQTNGKAKRSKNDSYSAETIGDNKYYFNDDGVMMTGWVAVKSSAESGDSTGISKFVYLGGDDEGIMAKINGWNFLHIPVILTTKMRSRQTATVMKYQMKANPTGII